MPLISWRVVVEDEAIFVWSIQSHFLVEKVKKYYNIEEKNRAKKWEIPSV